MVKPAWKIILTAIKCLPAHGSNSFYTLIIDALLPLQNRCVSIFRDPKKNNNPVGFALGSVEGRVAIQFIQPQNP